MKELCRVTRELEVRLAPKSPFYMAKYIMGNGQRKGNKLWGWNHNHIEMSRLIWWAYNTRQDRPWGTVVYLECTRGSRKSTLLQAAAVCYLLDDSNLTCLLDGDVLSKASEKTGVIRNMFDDPQFIERWGSRKSKTNWKNEQWTLQRTINSADASMKASGLDASKTGGHFDIIFCDDAQTDDNCKNPRINEQVKDNFRMYETLKSGKIGTVTIVGGTRWGFNDLGADLQKLAVEETRRGVTKSVFIIRRGAYVMGENKRAYQGVAQFAECGLTEEVLKRIKMKTTPTQFSFNYLLQPVADEEALVKSSWIRHHERSLDDFNLESTRLYLAIDPAGEGKFKGADFTAMVLIAVTNMSEIFVLEVVNEHFGKLEMYNKIVALNEAYPITGVVVETYFEQYQLASWMRSKSQRELLTIPWMKFKPSKHSKEQRIAALQPYFQSGKILWRKSHTELEDQTLQYPRSEHDDILDALASAIAHASVPGDEQQGPWFMDQAWKDTGAFQPTAKRPEPPSDLMVTVMRQDYLKKMGQAGRQERRFGAKTMRR